jgi:hypothetical protein
MMFCGKRYPNTFVTLCLFMDYLMNDTVSSSDIIVLMKAVLLVNHFSLTMDS